MNRQALSARGHRATMRALLAVAMVTALLPYSSHQVEAAGTQVPASATPVDISSSPLGTALIDAAASRFAMHGDKVLSSRLAAWTDASGILIAPIASEFVQVATILPDGTAGVELVPVTTPRTPAVAPASSDVDPLAASSWSRVGQDCYARISDTWSWLDHCYQMFKLTNDGDSIHDFFALMRYGTAGPNWPWVINYAGIGAIPTTASAPQTWVDWNPRGDRTGPCQGYTVSISLPLVGLSYDVDRCETWDMTKLAAGGNYAMLWQGYGTRNDRDVAFDISVRVPQGGWPNWSLPAYVAGGVA